jgi:murein DD-endopeptidase MepM/ murein hydrolase activator NlpD
MRAVLVMILGVIAPAGDVSVAVPPVRGVVVQRFVAPRCARCAGHRGVTIATTKGDLVFAVRSGVITFSGQVAGRSFIVERIAPGVRVTYGWVDSVADGVVEGVQVGAGEVLGTTGRLTYLGVRVGETYVEPLSHLGLRRVHLVGPGRAIVGSQVPSR